MWTAGPSHCPSETLLMTFTDHLPVPSRNTKLMLQIFDNCLPKNLRRLIYTHLLELMKLLGSNGSLVVPLYPPLGLIILPFLDRSRK
jgi:hypothetical protein